MTTIEGDRSFFLGAKAWVLEDDRELAWAETHVTRNPALKYILGRYVEAETANDNGHIFDLKELETAQHSIPNSPLNLLHHPRYIVGNFIATELVYPTEAAAGEQSANPFVEALSSFWRYYFPEEFKVVERAHQEGALYYSMEAIPKTVKCAAVCGQEYAYDGRTSDTYCAHLNQPGAKKRLGLPHFMGGGLIIPPTKPGWKRADITELSALMAEYADEAAQVYDSIRRELPHLDERAWESMVGEVIRFAYAEQEGGEWAKEFSPARRKELAGQKRAMPDGSYPIDDVESLADAIKGIGRANPADKGKVKAHIKRQAIALNKTEMIPDTW